MSHLCASDAFEESDAPPEAVDHSPREGGHFLGVLGPLGGLAAGFGGRHGGGAAESRDVTCREEPEIQLAWEEHAPILPPLTQPVVQDFLDCLSSPRNIRIVST